MLSLFLLFTLSTQPSYGLENKQRMAEQLGLIRSQILDLEQELIETLRTEKQAALAIKRAKKLYGLQQKERRLGQKRVVDLESTLSELQLRKGSLREKITVGERQVRQTLQSLWVAVHEKPRAINPHAFERLEAPRRHVLSLLAERGVRDMEALRVDLSDAGELEKKIEEEKSQISYLFQDLGEQEAILQLNQQLQVDVLNRRHEERLSQLENFKKLKVAEGQVQDMIVGLNSRKELERVIETERQVQGFLGLKGMLGFPGKTNKVLARFGRSYDPKSNIYVFKKGIELDVGKAADVTSVAAGKIAFVGDLEGYGRVTIIDHGGHYYSLLAHLGTLEKKQGDAVRAGERIGLSDELGSAIYFEIRAKSLPVDPLEWITQKEKSCERLGSC